VPTSHFNTNISFAGDIYLPPYNNCPLLFIRAVLRGDKEVFNRHYLWTAKIPLYKEFSIDSLRAMAAKDAELARYLLDEDMSKRPMLREFGYHVLATLRPRYVEEIVTHAQTLNQADPLAAEEKRIGVCSEVIEKLLQKPFISRK
jgi:hypothetical protein